MLSQFEYLLNKIVGMASRLSSLENYSQSNKIVLPVADGVRRIWLDGNTGAFRISDVGDDVLQTDVDDLAFYFNPETGELKMKGLLINTSAELFSHLSIEHFWTDSSTYVNRTGCRFALDGDKFTNQNVYFECVMANEQGSRAAYARIYNITDSCILAGSEITTGANPLTSMERVRSGVLTIPSGIKEYKLNVRMNQVGGEGDNAHFYAARLVHNQQ